MKILLTLFALLLVCNYFSNAQNGEQNSLNAVDLPTPGITCGSIQNSANIVKDSPWSALIYYVGHRSGFYCGGSIINSNYVLSAAHCFEGRPLGLGRYRAKFVRLGLIELGARRPCKTSTVNCTEPVIDIPIAEIITHENYTIMNDSHYNDIALIRFERPVTFTDRIRPICLPLAVNLKDRNFVNVPLTVIGFGRTVDGLRSNTKTMQHVKGYDLNQCNEAYNQTGIRLHRKQICAAGEHGEDNCSGGGGGSLIGEDSIEQIPYRYIVGIVSFGNRICGLPDSPGVYTRVDQFLDWILNHMTH